MPVAAQRAVTLVLRSPWRSRIIAWRETPGSEFALHVLHPEGRQHHFAYTANVAPLQGACLIYRCFPGHSGRAMMLFPFGEREAGLDSVNPYQDETNPTVYSLPPSDIFE